MAGTLCHNRASLRQPRTEGPSEGLRLGLLSAAVHQGLLQGDVRVESFQVEGLDAQDNSSLLRANGEAPERSHRVAERRGRQASGEAFRGRDGLTRSHRSDGFSSHGPDESPCRQIHQLLFQSHAVPLNPFVRCRRSSEKVHLRQRRSTRKLPRVCGVQPHFALSDYRKRAPSNIPSQYAFNCKRSLSVDRPRPDALFEQRHIIAPTEALQRHNFFRQKHNRPNFPAAADEMAAIKMFGDAES